MLPPNFCAAELMHVTLYSGRRRQRLSCSDREQGMAIGVLLLVTHDANVEVVRQHRTSLQIALERSLTVMVVEYPCSAWQVR